MPWRFVSALSFTQLISYGTLFYAFALIIEPMERELGWSKTALTAAYSLALVSSAFFAVPVGRLIDRGYGRAVMTGGSILAAVFLGLWAWTAHFLEGNERVKDFFPAMISELDNVADEQWKSSIEERFVRAARG